MARCRGCGRRLTRPSPAGYGPVCARRQGITRPARIRISRNPDQMAGQAELELQPMQPTLWSL